MVFKPCIITNSRFTKGPFLLDQPIFISCLPVISDFVYGVLDFCVKNIVRKINKMFKLKKNIQKFVVQYVQKCGFFGSEWSILRL